MARARVCDHCGRWIAEVEILYEMTITVQAEAPSTLEITDEELQKNAREEWLALLRRMEKMSDRDVDEAIDQVHESHEFVLCPTCREGVHRVLRAHRIPFESGDGQSPAPNDP